MILKSKLNPVLVATLLLLATSGLAFADQGNAYGNSLIGELSEVDVFHPPGENDPLYMYNEWHYFNVIDEEQDLFLICSFKLNGATELYGQGAETLLGCYIGSTPVVYGGTCSMFSNLVSYSNQTPDVIINKSMVLLTPQGYYVHIELDKGFGVTGNVPGKAVLDAVFKPEVEPSSEFIASDLFNFGTVNWLVASPKMKVNGKLTVEEGGMEQTFKLKNAKGYHDHNWGYWDWGNNLGWDWGQVTQTRSNLNGNDVGKYTLSFGSVTTNDPRDPVSSTLTLWKNKKIIAEFENSEVNVTHSFTYPTTEIPPSATVIKAGVDLENPEINASFTPDPSKIPIPLPIPIIDTTTGEQKWLIIWEIIGTYDVDGIIEGEKVSYGEKGFLEYVAQSSQYPEIPESSASNI